jgi:hypothetical protein
LHCKKIVKSREGEPIPIPYCDAHQQAGDGSVKVVKIQGEKWHSRSDCAIQSFGEII